MLKYQRTKVKLLEYEIPEDRWPKFPLKYSDLAYPTVLLISEYAEAVNTGANVKDKRDQLRACSDFYDAALQSKEQRIHDVDFALSAAASYFFADNFGSAKVLWTSVNVDAINDVYQKNLYDVFSLAFTGRAHNEQNEMLIQSIVTFWKDGDKKALEKAIAIYRENIFLTDSPQAWFWGEITCAITKIISKTSARILLPLFSGLDSNTWDSYFQRKNAINLLWPAQRLIGNSDILKGANAIIQLPTGVGKTKSIELIIWSMLLENRGSKAIIVAPLRSLCNEITHDMKLAFPKEISINQFSDVLEDDFEDIISDKVEKQIFICTPEKLQYIFHHEKSYLDKFDLFIFDESHMFDDPSRGALYELLLVDIKLEMNEKQQLILLSAVLPNADKIVEWLFGQNGRLAYNSSIKSTPKAIGFSDKKYQLHFFSGNSGEEDFFVPYTYTQKRLEPLGKERKKRYFPADSIDVALYYTDILCKNGGVAIYFNQRRSIPKLYSKIEDLAKRTFKLKSIEKSANSEEMAKFQSLFEAYYGKDNIYTKNITCGILPHYSSIPNGIKLATEYALKKGYIKVVACTSTLAQGVNIPVRYLLITGTNSYGSQKTVRNFQNLIGRTGRSGVYTEGDIIVTQSDLYDKRNQHKGYYKWKETQELFNADSVEACGSSILNIVKDFKLVYSVNILGSDIVDFICNNINDNWNKKLQGKILKGINNDYPKINMNACKAELDARISSYKESVDAIENEIVYLLSSDSKQENPENLKDIAQELLTNSLAYFLGNTSEKTLLVRLFRAIEARVAENMNYVQKYSGTMVSIADANEIIKWINEYNINNVSRPLSDLIVLIERLYRIIHPSFELIEGFAQAWIRGDSYEKMQNNFSLKIYDVEKYSQYNISYQMSFLVGNIVDLVAEGCTNYDDLLLLQQELRYGVDSRTAVSFSEKIFYDRYLARRIAELIGNNEVTSEEIVSITKLKKDPIVALLRNYPTYFESVIENL
jgi:superfamily II DNA/RNA helicase